MLNTSFPRSLWFFLEIVTIIGITSNLSFNTNEHSKYPKVLVKVKVLWPTQQNGCKLLYCKVGFPMLSQKFFGISVSLLLVFSCISKSKLLILTFSMILLFFCSIIFTLVCLFLYWKDLYTGFVFYNSFNVFFLFCIQFDSSSFLSNLYKFSQILSIFLFLISRPQIFFNIYISANISSLGWLL